MDQRLKLPPNEPDSELESSQEHFFFYKGEFGRDTTCNWGETSF